MVKKNDYPRKNFSKDGVQTGEPANTNSNSQQKPFQKDGEMVSHRETHVRNTRPPRDNQQRENSGPKEYNQRDSQRDTQRDPQRDTQKNMGRDNQVRDNAVKDNAQRDNQQRDNQHRENHQRNFHKDNQNRETGRENKEAFRQHFQRPVIKPRAEETVEDIAADIGRIEKEIELEMKEIKSMRLGV